MQIRVELQVLLETTILKVVLLRLQVYFQVHTTSVCRDTLTNAIASLELEFKDLIAQNILIPRKFSKNTVYDLSESTSSLNEDRE